MNNVAPAQAAPAASARLRAARAEAIKEGWRAGQAPDAAAALRDHPDLAADRAAALDLAYEEFCTREESGERLDSAEFCARFPFGASLRRLINVHRFLDSHPDALTGTPAAWPAPGESVADFLILRELGRGGFSRVYLALEGTAGARPVALKVAASGSREADTLGPLSHPHLMPVYSSRGVGEWNAVAMPFVGTATLEDALSAAWCPGAPDRPRTAAVLREAAARGGHDGDPDFPARPAFPLHAGVSYDEGVCAVACALLSALAYLHAKGVAHRDLKPSNVLLAPTGHPYLLDFNLATREADPIRLAGTLPYMAPEQLAMVADAGAPAPGDWRPCDVFAFGVMLTELLTGRHPFGAGGVPAEAGQTEAAARLLAAQKAGAAALPAHVPPAVRAALSRCLELDPVQRPTAAELATLFGPTRPPPRTRRRLLLALAALSTALALASLIPGRGAPAPQPKDEARAAPAEPPPPTDAFARGVACFHRKEYVQGWHEFQRAGEEKKDGRAHACAAYCFALLKDHRAAIPEWDKAIRLNYRDPAVYANRAFSYLQTGQRERAKADCDAALQIDPGLRAARLTRAVYHLRQHARGERLAPEAVADIEKVLTGEPNTAEVWMTAAQLFAAASAERPDLLERAADAVRRAILAGKEPRLISRNPLLVKALGGHPSFQAALRTAPGVPQAAPDPQMVNVIP